MKNINEQINRIKSLFTEERLFGNLVEESPSLEIIKNYNEKGNLIKESVIIPYSQIATYNPGSSDPSSFIKEFVENLIKKIDSTPEGKKMRESGQMVLLTGTFTGSASNSWGEVKTGYDIENDMKTKTKPSETEYYTKNLNLALNRAKIFEQNLWTLLEKYKIKKLENVSVIKTTSVVVNTGGVNDNVRDQSKFPNPGQKITVNLEFEYESKIGKPKTDTILPETPEDILPNMILTGSYFCNGKNSQGKDALSGTSVNQCKELPQNLKDGKHISAWEIKWNTNVVKNAYTVPLYRWNFYWDKNGKITKIVGQQYNNDTKYPINKSFPPSNDIPKNDPMMISLMGINQNVKDGGTLYKNFIKPFI
jgi:hypothetical protein